MSLAHDAHTAEPPHDHHDHPCACLEAWVFVGYEDEHGEWREASYRCRRCNAGDLR